MRRWESLVDGYLRECEVRGLATSTIDGRRRELERWGQWLRGRRPRPRIEAIDAEMVVAYLRSRSAFRSRSTIASSVTILRGMGEYLVRAGLWTSNPLRWISGPKLDHRHRLPRRLGDREMEALWSAASTAREGYQRHRWVAMLAVLYGTGLRRGELVSLDLSDLDEDGQLLLVDGRKTGRQRRVPLPEVTARCIAAYLPQRHNLLERIGRIDEPALFVNRRGVRMRPAVVSQAMQRLARRAGLEGVTLHQFRHTCASDLLAAGARLPEVQGILGHQVIQTTMRYLHIESAERHEAVACHPLNEWLQVEEAA